MHASKEPVITAGQKAESVLKDDRLSKEPFGDITFQELADEESDHKDFRRESFMEALQLDEAAASSAKPRPAELFPKDLDITAVVKTQILDEELGQSIEESPLEVKYIAEEIEKGVVDNDEKMFDHIESRSIERNKCSVVNKSDEFEIECAATSSQLEQQWSVSSSENIDRDDLKEYDEARDEYSLSEQLAALASNTTRPLKETNEDEYASFKSRFDDKSGFTSRIPKRCGGRSDMDPFRSSKDLGFSRSEKKEIRSLKTTKQVSTIEEHSSIESSDSPHELYHHDFSEEHVILASEEEEMLEKKTNEQPQGVLPDDSMLPSTSQKPDSEDSDDFGSKGDSDDCFKGKSLGTRKSPDKDGKSSKKSDSSDSDSKKMPCVAELSAPCRKDESFSSSGDMESHYYSVDTSDSGKSPARSRPCSSEFEANVLSGQGSEYETCATSQEGTGEISGTYNTAATSQETSYSTACSSFSHSSRESAYSVDSESSGHLASVEVSSEASETLVPSAQEMELEFGGDTEMPVLDEECSSPATLKEPYDMEIPESVIRSGIEIELMKNWDLQSGMHGQTMDQATHWPWQHPPDFEEGAFKMPELAEGEDFTHQLVGIPSGSHDSQIPKTTSADSQSSSSTIHSDTKHSGTSSDSKKQDDAPSAFFKEMQSTKHMTVVNDENDHRTICLDEEQHSMSEGSVSQSEQTWQTRSCNTALQISGHVSSPCLNPENQFATSVTDSLYDIPPEFTSSLEQAAIETEEPSSFLQLNGPVEVDYNPEYDTFDGGVGAPQGENPEDLNSQPDDMQFVLEAHNGNAYIQNGSFNGHDLEIENNLYVNGAASGSNENLHSSSNSPSAPCQGSSQSLGTLAEAEQPEAQQAQDYEDQLTLEGAAFQYPTSYLPESDQGNLGLPSESFNDVPGTILEASNDESSFVADANGESAPTVQICDYVDRGEIVDTSPEDEQYDFQKASTSVETKRSGIDLEIDDEPKSCTQPREDDLEFTESDLYPNLCPEDDKQSTPSFDPLQNRRFFTHSGDTSGASSLQEFERLEADISGGRCSQSSGESLEKLGSTPSDIARRGLQQSGNSSTASSLQEFQRLEAEIAASPLSRASLNDTYDKASSSKTSEHDEEDQTIFSLTEFENLERQCRKAEEIISSHDVVLSKIEERPESQSQSSDPVVPEQDDSDDDDEYEKRFSNIEEIIKIAQTNVEMFSEETVEDISEVCTFEEYTASGDNSLGSTSKVTVGEADLMFCSEMEAQDQNLAADDADNSIGHDSSSNSSSKRDCMLSSTDSVDPSSSTATHATYQFETDSLMSSSINSTQASGEECAMVSSTDTLEPENKLTYSQGDLTNEDNNDASGGIVSESSCIQVSSHEYSRESASDSVANRPPGDMETFLAKFTDDSLESSDQASSDATLKTCYSPPDLPLSSHSDILHHAGSSEAIPPISDKDDGETGDDDIISRTRTTTTTRIVTTVTTDDDLESEPQIQLDTNLDDVINQFMSDGGTASHEPSTQR